MSPKNTAHPMTSLFIAIIDEIANLVRTEARMARAEVRESIGRLNSGGIMVGIGAVLVLPGLVVLLLAIAEWLAVAGLALEWGLLLVSVAVLVVGGAFVMAGISAIRRASLVPERTIAQVRADFSTAREQMQ